MAKGSVKVGETILVHINSVHNGEPIAFKVEGKVVRRKGELHIRLRNGMEAPLSAAKVERLTRRKRGKRK